MFPNYNEALTPSEDVGISRVPGFCKPTTDDGKALELGNLLVNREMSRKRSQSEGVQPTVSSQSFSFTQSPKRPNVLHSNVKCDSCKPVSTFAFSTTSDTLISVSAIRRPSSLPIPSHDSLRSRQHLHEVVTNCNSSKIFTELNATYTPTADMMNLTTLDVQDNRSNSAQSLQDLDDKCESVTKVTLYTKTGQSHDKYGLLSSWRPVSPSSIGICKPILAPGNFSRCMHCNTKFSLIRHRHHCRACGRLVCAACCGYRFNLPFQLPDSLSYAHATYGRNICSGRRQRNSLTLLANRSSVMSKIPKQQRISRISLHTRSRICIGCFNYLTKRQTIVHSNSVGAEDTLVNIHHNNNNNNNNNNDNCNHNNAVPTNKNGGQQLPVSYSKTGYDIMNGYSIILNDGINVDMSTKLRFDPTIVNTSSASKCDHLLPVAGMNNQWELIQSECWPPLVISVHSELVLQYNPPRSLIISLLDTGLNPPDSTSHSSRLLNQEFEADRCLPWSTRKSLSLITSDRSNFTRIAPTSDWIPPGITVALTRNLHVHVHSTELNCCLKQPAWCFTSTGFYQYSQEEIVILLRKRPNEQLPPKELFHQYLYIYKALLSRTEQAQWRNEIKFEPLSAQPFNTSSGSAAFGPFRSHDCFFPHFYLANRQNSDSAYEKSSFGQFGLLFFHPTHQCLQGLQLPNTPFLIGLLIYLKEAVWAYHLPARLLLRLGKLMRYYPTPLLSDRDRDIVFDCAKGVSFLQLFSNLNLPTAFHTTPSRLPDLCFQMKGLHVQLNCAESSVNYLSSDCRTKLELLMPLSSQFSLVKFLNSIPEEAPAFIFIADFNPFSNSHLVCIQSVDDSFQNLSTINHKIRKCHHTDSLSHSEIIDRAKFRDYSTAAISIKDTNPQIIGINFVAFSADSTSDEIVVDIIEDGVCVHLTIADFTNLIEALKSGVNHKITKAKEGGYESITEVDLSSHPTLPPTNCIHNILSVNVEWFESLQSVSAVGSSKCADLTASHQVSFIDMQYLQPVCTYLVPVYYQLWHWLQLIESMCTNHYTTDRILHPSFASQKQRISVDNNLRLIWTRFHLLSENKKAFAVDAVTNEVINLGKLADDIAKQMIHALHPCLHNLRMNNRTQIALRVQLQPPDQVGYQLGAVCNEFGLQTTNSFNNDLDPIDHKMLAIGMNNLLLPALNTWVRALKLVPFNANEYRHQASKINEKPSTNDDVADLEVKSHTIDDDSMLLALEFDFSILD